MAYLLDVLHSLSPSGPIKTVLPKTMESVGQNYGFLLYRTQIPQKFANTNAELEILGLRDRGIILVGQVRELLLITICESLKKLSHQAPVQWVGENLGNKVALTSRGKLGRATDFRKDFRDCYNAKEKFRPFPSYPKLLFQSDAKIAMSGTVLRTRERLFYA